MLKILNQTYKACSNIFVETFESKHYTYPAPLSLNVVQETKDSSNIQTFNITVNNYYDSILTLNYTFNATIFLLTFDYIIHVYYFIGLLKKYDKITGSDNSGEYNYHSIEMNICESDIYKLYNKHTLIFDNHGK